MADMAVLEGQDRVAAHAAIMKNVEQELGAAAGAFLMSVCLAALRQPAAALQVIKQTEQALQITQEQIDAAQQLAAGSQGTDAPGTTPAVAAALE